MKPKNEAFALTFKEQLDKEAKYETSSQKILSPPSPVRREITEQKSQSKMELIGRSHVLGQAEKKDSKAIITDGAGIKNDYGSPFKIVEELP